MHQWPNDDPELPNDRQKITKRSLWAGTLEPDTSWWCRCGRASDQPYGDGTRKSLD